MCGVVGIAGELPGKDVGDRVLQKLKHRGPDGRGAVTVWAGGQPVWLGHTRLAILDLSPAGQQPMQSQEGRWWVTYNGEIYNHRELREELAVPFRGHSDTETLVEGLAEYGVNALLPRLNGMFAFAAVDTREGKLYLARDPFGVKPLYYIQSTDGLAFASELRALHAVTVTRSEVDPGALDTFLTLRYVPSPRTLWRGVSRLPPGHVLTYDLARNRVALSRYVTPNTERFAGSLDDAVNVYRDVLDAAVKRQLLSDVPVGVLLSGGIDSALVAALAREARPSLKAFTVGFGKGHPECEIADAAETAQVLGLEHASIEVTPESLIQVIPEIVGAVEEPLGTTSILPMWYLVRRAREQVTVVLTGQGNDEPWGGYRRYQLELLRSMFPFPSLFRMLRPLHCLWSTMPEVLERGLRSLPIGDMAQRFVEAYALFPAADRVLLTGRNSDGGARQAIETWLRWLEPYDWDPAERMMRIDSRMNLADDLLLYGDKIAMACSLEARVPMLDLEVIRFVESLPLAYRVALARTKIVHKRMAQSYLPGAIVQRRKKGFQVPYGVWSRGPWREWIEGILLDRQSPHMSHLNEKGLRRLWKQHLKPRSDRSRQMFALLTLAIWWKQQEGWR